MKELKELMLLVKQQNIKGSIGRRPMQKTHRRPLVCLIIVKRTIYGLLSV